MDRRIRSNMFRSFTDKNEIYKALGRPKQLYIFGGYDADNASLFSPTTLKVSNTISEE